MGKLTISSKPIFASRWETITKKPFSGYPRQARKLPVLVIFLFILGLTISSCVNLNDPEASQEYRADVVGKVTVNSSVGQTFISRRSSLRSIQIWYFLDTEVAPQSGNLDARLYTSPDEKTPISSYTISFSNLANNNSLTIPFEIQSNAPDQSYYLELTSNSGELLIYGRNEDVYPDGQSYINRAAENADLSFRLSYEYGFPSLREDILQIISISYLLIPLLLLLWVPGRLVLDLLPIRDEIDVVEKLAMSFGLSIAFTPLLLLWTSTIGLRWQRASAILFYGLCFIIFVWIKRDTIREFIFKPKIGEPRKLFLPISFLTIVIFVLITRVAMVRDMAAPAWVDSVHHALIADLITEQGKYPDTYYPLVAVDPATYHPGFHSIIAAFRWMTDMEIHTALLLLGQVFNILMVFGVYLFTKTLTKSSHAGLFAALISGLMTPMPAYYTSWGRYTQLAGLLILPTVSILLVWVINRMVAEYSLPNSRKTWRRTLPSITVAGGVLAGLYLTHYRVSLFTITLIGVFILIAFLGNIKHKVKLKGLLLATGVVVFIGIISLVLTTVWWPKALSSLILPRLTVESATVRLFSDFSWYYLTTALGTWAMILAGLGAILGLLQRERFVIILLLWVCALFFFANLGSFNLPGAQFVNNTSVTIMLFIPISTLAGYFIASLLININMWIIKPWRYLYQAVASIAVIVLMVISAQAIIPILNPITILAREVDIKAMDWIEDNIPGNEVIMINPFSWGYGMYAGSDGGYWISPIASRPTMPPPILYGLNQELGTKVVKISSEVIALSNDPDALHQYLTDQGIQYIYLGAKGGALSPRTLSQSTKFKTLYHVEDTWVFMLN